MCRRKTKLIKCDGCKLEFTDTSINMNIREIRHIEKWVGHKTYVEEKLCRLCQRKLGNIFRYMTYPNGDKIPWSEKESIEWYKYVEQRNGVMTSLPKYCYDDEHEEGYWKIECDMCGSETTISELQMQHCVDNGHGDEPVCHPCMWGVD